MAPDPSCELLLATWEQAYGLSPAARGVALLGLALPRRQVEELRAMSLGQRDAALLDLRARLFGPRLQSVASCPACGDKVELDFLVDDMRIAEAGAPTPVHVALGRRKLTARAATCDDVLFIEQLTGSASRRTALLDRCVQSEGKQRRATTPTFTADEERLLASRLAECDPQADVRIGLECFACAHAWQARFDIVRFLWQELDAWAQRLLAEVHLLASAYGWSERSIVTMSPWRRQLYLEMLRQ
jgi:hypothetical protein